MQMFYFFGRHGQRLMTTNHIRKQHHKWNVQWNAPINKKLLIITQLLLSYAMFLHLWRQGQNVVCCKVTSCNHHQILSSPEGPYRESVKLTYLCGGAETEDDAEDQVGGSLRGQDQVPQSPGHTQQHGQRQTDEEHRPQRRRFGADQQNMTSWWVQVILWK